MSTSQKKNDELYGILSEIDNIVLESEIAVLDSLVGAYYKQAIMLEYVSPEFFEDSSIIQEGFKDDLNTGIKGAPNEKLIKTILLAIPRLIVSLVNWIKKKWNIKRMKKDIDVVVTECKDLTDEEIEKVVTDSDDATNDSDTQPDKTQSEPKSVYKKKEIDIRKIEELKKLRDGQIRTPFKFDNVKTYLDHCCAYLEILENAAENGNIDSYAPRINRINDQLKKAFNYVRNNRDDDIEYEKRFRAGNIRNAAVSPSYIGDVSGDFIDVTEYKKFLDELDQSIKEINIRADKLQRIFDNYEIERKIVNDHNNRRHWNAAYVTTTDMVRDCLDILTVIDHQRVNLKSYVARVNNAKNQTIKGVRGDVKKDK